MKKHYFILSALGIILIALLALNKGLPKDSPPEECSPIYHKYLNDPDINATFLKDFRINDTLALNAIILQPSNPDGWHRLAYDFNFLDKKDFYLSGKRGLSNFLIPKNLPDSTPYSGVPIPSDSLSSFPDFVSIALHKQQICIFHTNNMNEVTAIFEKLSNDITNNN